MIEHLEASLTAACIEREVGGGWGNTIDWSRLGCPPHAFFMKAQLAIAIRPRKTEQAFCLPSTFVKRLQAVSAASFVAPESFSICRTSAPTG